MQTLVQVIALVVMGIVILALGSLFVGILVYLLWNWLIPAIFLGPKITLLQAIGLTFLSSLLFKSSTSSSNNNK